MSDERKSWFRRHKVLTGIAGLFVLVIVASSMGGADQPAEATATAATGGDVVAAPPAVPTVVNAKKFGDEYEANQVAAEHKWRGKYVQFTSSVTNINSSSVSFGNVTSKQFSLTQISCRVADESQVINLVKGTKATVRGIVDDDQLMGVITINDCEVVG